MFEVERRGDACIVHVDEDLDIACKERLGASVEAAEGVDSPRLIVVSLERCAYCDSSGLAELLKAYKRLRQRLVVVVPSGSQCRRIFEITGLNAILQISPSIDSALLLSVTSD